MGVTLRFIASPEEGREVLDWFGALPNPPDAYPKPHGALLYFRQLGELAMIGENELDVKHSPLVSVFLPHVRHEVLWTVGEVHFLSDRMRSSFPQLHGTLKEFQKWLQTFPLVFRRHPQEVHGGQWNYYLEGGVQNYDSEIYALPGGMAALQRGRYFVCGSDTEARLEKILKMLKLRGVTNLQPETPPYGSTQY